MTTTNPRLVSSASFFAILNQNRIHTSTTSNLNNTIHSFSTIHPTNNDNDNDDLSSISSKQSIYLSSLHISSSSSDETEDDPNDTKIYRSIDRRPSYIPQSTLKRRTTNRHTTNTSNRPKKKINIINTTNTRTKIKSTKPKLTKKRAPLISNTTHKCICLSTKVRERLEHLHTQAKAQDKTIKSYKIKRKKARKTMKQLENQTIVERDHFHHCRSHLLIGTIQSFYRSWTIRAFHTWRTKTNRIKSYEMSLNWMNRRFKRTATHQALSKWKQVVHHYLLMQLQNQTLENSAQESKLLILQQQFNEADSDRIKLKKQKNETRTKNRKQRIDRQQKAMCKLRRTFNRSLFKKTFSKWQQMVIQWNASMQQMKQTKKRLIQKSCRLKQLLQICTKRRNKKIKSTRFKEWVLVLNTGIMQRIELQRHRKTTRRVMLSCGLSMTFFKLKFKRVAFIKWKKKMYLDRRRDNALHRIQRRLGTKKMNQFFHKWNTKMQRDRKIQQKVQHLCVVRRQNILTTFIKLWKHCIQEQLQTKSTYKQGCSTMQCILQRHYLHYSFQKFHTNMQQQRVKEKVLRHIIKTGYKTMKHCYEKWWMHVHLSKKLRNRNQWHQKKCRKNLLNKTFISWFRKIEKEKKEKLNNERLEYDLYLEKNILLERLLTKKHYIETQDTELSLLKGFHVWKTDSLLMEGLEAMNDISGHLKAASILRNHISKYRNHQLTR